MTQHFDYRLNASFLHNDVLCQTEQQFNGRSVTTIRQCIQQEQLLEEPQVIH